MAKLEPLLHENSKLAQMRGTWKKAQELDAIKAGFVSAQHLAEHPDSPHRSELV